MDEGRNKAVNVFLQSAVSYVRAKENIQTFRIPGRRIVRGDTDAQEP